jgi:hypothetical protein
MSSNINIHYLDKSIETHIFLNYSKMYIITILEILTCDSVGYKGNMFKILYF